MAAGSKKRDTTTRKDNQNDGSPKKKRKLDVSNETETIFKSPQKEKDISQAVSDFCAKDFVSKLRNPSATFSAFEKFISLAEDYNGAASYDVVKELCLVKDGVFEILTVLEAGKRKSTEYHTIFRVLSLVLLRIADDLAEFVSDGERVVQRLLSTSPGALYHQLAMRNKAAHIKSCLRLITAMVMISPICARDVFMQLDFSSSKADIYHLFNRRDVKDPEDVRQCVLLFVMSFLIAGDDGLIIQMVEQKFLLQAVFKDIHMDKLVAIESILPTVQNKVVKNPMVNKTLKVKLFNEVSLQHLCRLFSWQGPKKWNANKSANKSGIDIVVENEFDGSMSSDVSAVYDLIQVFLIDLCTVQKTGILFFDKSCGTAPRNVNPLITSVLKNLQGQLSVAKVQELVIRLIQACPDQLTRFMTHLKSSLTPRLSQKWLAMVDFTCQVYEKVFSWSYLSKLISLVNVDKLLVIISNTTIPPMLEDLLTGLKSEHIAVCHGVLAVLKVVLTNTVTVLQSSDHWTPENCPYTPTEKTDFKQSFVDLLTKKLPSLQMIMTVWQNAAKVPAENTVKDKPPGGDIDLLDHMLRIEEALIHLLEVVPVSSDVIGVTSLLDNIRKQEEASNNQEKQDKISLLQINLLQIINKMNMKNLFWTKLTKDGDSVCHLLLEMLTNTSHNAALTTQTKQLITQMIIGTGFFGETSGEIAEWLNQIISRAEEKIGQTVDFFSMILSKFFTNPYQYLDKMDTVSAVRVDDTEERKQTERTVVNVDEILKMDFDIEQLLGSSDPDNSAASLLEEDQKNMGKRFPFSPLVIVALETLSASEIGCVEYVCEVLMGILHSQKDPVPLCTLIQNHSSVLQGAALYQYFISWISKSKDKTDLDIDSSSQQLCYQLIKLSYNFSQLSKDVSLMKKIKQGLKGTTDGDILGYGEQLMFYIRTTVNAPDKGLKGSKSEISVYFSFLEILLSRALEWTAGVDLNVNDGDDSIPLFINKDSSVSKILEKFWEIFLGDDLLQKFFLGTFSKALNFNQYQTKVSNLITEHMSKLIKVLPWHEHSRTFPKLDTLFQNYVNKICEGVQMNISELSRIHKKDSAQLFPESLQIALDGFLPYFSLRSLISLANSLLKISPKNLKQLPMESHRELLQDVLQRICKHGSSRSGLATDSSSQLFGLLVLPQYQTESFLKTCLMLIKLWPDYCLHADDSLVDSLLSGPSDVKTKMISIVTSQNPLLRDHLFSRIQEPQLRDDSDVYFHLCLALATSALAEGDTNSLSVITENVWGDLFNWLVVSSSENQLKDVRSDLWFTILTCLGDKRLKSVADALIEKFSNQTVDVNILHLHTLKISTDLLNNTNDLKSELLSSYLDRLIISLRKKNQSDVVHIQTALFSQIRQILQDTSLDDLDRSHLVEVWPTFVKYVLKMCFTSGEALAVLEKLVSVVYRSDSDDTPSPTLTVLYQMVTSHSKFIPVMFEEEATEANVDLVRLMLRIVEACADCCEKSHVAVILGAYQATLSLTDQMLLKLLILYENNGTGLANQRDYLWGLKARDYYSSLTKGKSLLTQLSTNQIIEMLDEDKLRRSTYNFPLRRTLIPYGIVPSEELQGKAECYDPCFVLPLLTHMLGPESLLDCYQFVKSGCLGYIFAALSVHDEVMRSSAYLALKLFYQHMEGSKFMGKDQVFYLVNTMRNSIGAPNTKLASIITHFIAKALTSICKPESHMFQMVNSFLLLKPEMDIVNVPEFYKFFNSSSFEFKHERGWMLELLETGLRERRDFRIYEKRFIFKLLLSFYHSPLSDNWCKGQILKILLAGCHEKSVTFELLMHHGILSWISGIVESSCKHAERSSQIIEIVTRLWKTVKQNTTSTHYLPVLPQLQLLLHHIIRNFSEVMTVEKETECVQILCDIVESSDVAYLSSNCGLLIVSELFYHYYTITKDERRKDQIHLAIELAGYKPTSWAKNKQRTFSGGENSVKSRSVERTEPLNTSTISPCTKPENRNTSLNSHLSSQNALILTGNAQTELLKSITQLTYIWLPVHYGNITGDVLQSITVLFIAVSETLLLQQNTSLTVDHNLINLLKWLEKWLCTDSSLSAHLCKVVLDSSAKDTQTDSIVSLLLRIYTKLTQQTKEYLRDSLELRETCVKKPEVNCKDVLILLSRICLSLAKSVRKKTDKSMDILKVQQNIKGGQHLMAGFYMRRLMLFSQELY